MENTTGVRRDLTTRRASRNIQPQAPASPELSDFRKAANETIGFLDLLSDRLTAELTEYGSYEDRLGVGILRLVRRCRRALHAQSRTLQRADLEDDVYEVHALIELMTERLGAEYAHTDPDDEDAASVEGIGDIALAVQSALLSATSELLTVTEGSAR